MKGISGMVSRIGTSSGPWACWALTGAMLLAGPRAEAAAIRHEESKRADVAPIPRENLSRGDTTTFKEWSRYVLAGPSVWAEVLHPPVTPAVRSSIWESVRTDPGGANPMVKFLLWKQGIDPTRFALYHPKLSPALDKILKSVPVAPQSLIPPLASSTSGTPSTPSSAPAPAPAPVSEQGLNPPPIPEPSMWLLAVGMAGWGIWRHRRAGSKR